MAMLNSGARQTVGQPAGQPSTQSPRKLRDSCTDCASSKVKCSKEKPTCARCARRGVKCTYMVSRRTGRTSSSVSLSKGSPAQLWIGANHESVGVLGRSTFPSATPNSSNNRSMSLPGSFGPALGTTTLPGSPSISGNSNNTTNSSYRNEIAATHKHSETPLLSDAIITTTVGEHPSAVSDIDSNELWSSILSPSIFMVDLAGLSPPLTTIDTDVGDLFDMDLHSPMDLDSLEQPATTGIDTHHATSPYYFGDIDLSASNPDFASPADISFDWDLPSSSSSSSDGNNMSNGSVTPANCCFTVALDILTGLFPNAHPSCTLTRTRGILDGGPDGSPANNVKARTIDSVISKNKDIIESLTALLDCHCSQDEYLISIMTLIALRVMGWYSAAAADDCPSRLPSPVTPVFGAATTTTPWPAAVIQPDSFASLSPLSDSPIDRGPRSSASTPSLAGQVLRLPAAVGEYCVAGRQQGRMAAAQLVLGELERVQRLVNALCERLEGIRLRVGQSEDGPLLPSSSSGSSSGVGSGREEGAGLARRVPPFSVPTFCVLEEDLRKRLRALSSEMVDVLRRA